MKKRVAVFALVLVAGVAHAGSGKLVPLEPEMPADTASQFRERFMEAVAKGIGGAGFEEISPREVRQRLDSMNVATCSGGDCAEKLVVAFGADGAVKVSIEQKHKNFRFSVDIFDSAGHVVGKTETDRCDICTQNEAALGLEKLVRAHCIASAAQLSRAADEEGPETPHKNAVTPAKPPAKLKDEDEPVGGVRPAKVKPQVVTTQPAVQHPAPEKPPVAVAVDKPKDEPPAKDGLHLPWGNLAYAALGVTAVALVATIVFSVYASKDSLPTCSAADPTHDCPQIYSGNAAPAVTFGVLTALAAGGGAFMWYLDRRAHRREPVSLLIAPTRDGAAASMAFRF